MSSIKLQKKKLYGFIVIHFHLRMMVEVFNNISSLDRNFAFISEQTHYFIHKSFFKKKKKL